MTRSSVAPCPPLHFNANIRRRRDFVHGGTASHGYFQRRRQAVAQHPISISLFGAGDSCKLDAQMRCQIMPAKFLEFRVGNFGKTGNPFAGAEKFTQRPRVTCDSAFDAIPIGLNGRQTADKYLTRRCRQRYSWEQRHRASAWWNHHRLESNSTGTMTLSEPERNPSRSSPT